jgi:hypothetical protein
VQFQVTGSSQYVFGHHTQVVIPGLRQAEKRLKFTLVGFRMGLSEVDCFCPGMVQNGSDIELVDVA